MIVDLDDGRVWTEDEHAALKARNIGDISYRHNLAGTVRQGTDPSGKTHYIKSLPHDSDELAIWKTLLSNPATRDYVVPAEFVPCKESTLALMPLLIRTMGPSIWDTFEDVPPAMRKFLKGLALMHDLGIAHFDLHLENFMYSDPVYCPLEENQTRKIHFLIDFGSSRLMTKRPGEQPPEVVTDYMERGGHFPPPEGMDIVEPYAYDVYSAGCTVGLPCWDMSGQDEALKLVPFAYWMFSSMLAAKVPAHRPTMRRAVQIFSVLEPYLKMTRWLYWFLPTQLAKYYDFLGWVTVNRMIYSSWRKMAKA